MNARAEHEVAFDLSAATVDSASGVIRGVTAMKAGVKAKGKFVMLDGAGVRTTDIKLMKSRIPAFTDMETLHTLMGAAQDAGGRVKVRSDHDNSLSARAGHATNFRLLEDRVVCDLHLNRAYRDRDTVIETAQKTPELMGCSIDFDPEFVIEKNKALMRVSILSAVDLVDEGAVTPNGLFMASRVDNENKDNASSESETDSLTTMAKADEKKTAPTIDECMAAVTEMAGKLAEFNAAMTAMKSAPASASLSAVDELNVTLKAIKADQEKLSAEQATFITEQKATLATLAKERAALGLNSESAKKLTEGEEQETERVRLAAAKAKEDKTPKTYLALVAAKKAEGKLSAPDCHRYVMSAHADAYAAHQIAQGIVKAPVL